MNGLRLAFGWMTILPVGAVKSETKMSEMMPWLPLTGVVVGLFVLLAACLGQTIDPWLGAVLGVLVWLLMTGGLHADGLADLTDACAAAHADKERFVEVLKDPHIGSFGVLALIGLVLLKVVLLKILIDMQVWWAVWLIPVWARLGVLFWVRLPSFTQGFSALVSGGDVRISTIFWLVILVALSLFLMPILLLACVVIILWYQFLKHRFKGVNGDCLGAGIECSEVFLLFSLLFSTSY
ncbi:MAG: adenosylcobinamide-GDP ribazoletransferase [Mariprofundaceae bacterium]